MIRWGGYTRVRIRYRKGRHSFPLEPSLFLREPQNRRGPLRIWPLPNRRNVVLSTQKDLICPDAEVFSSLEEALNSCQPDEHVYIIGGASVYRQALPFAGALCLTEVDAEAPQVDAYFPEVAPTVWQEKSRESHPADEKHPCPYAFVDYIRR